MRTLTDSALTALANTTYQLVIGGSLDPSNVYFDTLDGDHVPAWADAVGIPDNPIIQEIGVNPSSPYTLATFYNHSDTLQYQIAGTSTVVDTAVSIVGKPAVFGNYLFTITGGYLTRYNLDWSAVASLSSSILSSAVQVYSGYSGSPGASIHALSNTECMVIAYEDGGFRAHYHTTTGTHYAQSNRFMFPKMLKYYDEDDGETEQSLSTLILNTSALKLGNEVFAYASNCVTGSVDGVVLSLTSHEFSDIFVAVASELSSSLSEFRCANAFTSGSSGYMSGQFIRKDNATDYTPYSLILKTVNGRIFSMDRLTLVSADGYRLLANVTNNTLYVNGCNRWASEPATYYFLGIGNTASASALTLNNTDFVSFSDSGRSQAGVELASGNHALMFHDYMRVGSRLLIDMGYDTSTGEEKIRFGSYILSDAGGSIANGERQLTPTFTNESQFNLDSMSSPFYTQIISKSSCKDEMKDLSNLYTASNTGVVENRLCVDFWDCEEYDDEVNGITGVVPVEKGGVSGWSFSGDHRVGCKTKDLITEYSIGDYPKLTGSTLHAHLYGWSSNQSGSVNDLIGMTLFLKDSDGNEYTKFVEATKRWPNTYLTATAGDNPIEYDITGLTEGDKIIAVGIFADGDTDMLTCPSRIELTGDLMVLRESNANIPWVATSGSGFEIPGSCAPRIMFSTKPTNAFNFVSRATFRSTVTGYVSGYPCGYGLVGLAEDGQNYIVGRYNLSSALLEIVKVRDGAETILSSGSPGSAIGEICQMAFAHRDGRFSISIYRNSDWEEDLTYTWVASDGWLFTGTVEDMHVGIYSVIQQPYFYTVGLDTGADEGSTNSDAIPIMPGQSFSILDSFPSSGEVLIDGNRYSYSGKGTASDCVGPYQFRNNGDGTYGAYMPPYGSGEPGLECLFLNWTGTDGDYAAYVIAISDGGSYICTGSKFQVWITTDGEVIYLHDRSRFVASGSLIGDTYYDLSNRVYLTSGLLEPTLIKGDSTIHAINSRVELAYDGSIWCQAFDSSSGDIDVTVEDLIDRISKSCNAVANFPGDTLYDTLTYNGTDLALATQTYMSGFDVRFTIPVLSAGNTIDLVSDTQARGYTGCTQTYIRLSCLSSGSYRVGFYISPGDILVDSMGFSMTDLPHAIRILYHDNFATVYMDERWVHTFAITPFENDADPVHDIPGISYDDSMDLILRSNVNGISFSDVRVCELADWREAVYIDLETNGSSAISSVIQERPVEIVHEYDGSISYTYEPVRSTITPGFITRDSFKKAFPGSSGSDAIVYYSDVRVYQYPDYAKEFGLSTKVVRLPNLERGAVKAAQISMKKQFEQNNAHSLDMRPDLRIEIGDKVHVVYSSTGTVKAMDYTIIVESVALSFRQNCDSSMTITGRETSE